GSTDGVTWTLLDDRTGADQNVPLTRRVFVPGDSPPFFSLLPPAGVSLIKGGTGTLTLSNNTYTGGTLINGGAIVATSNTSLGAGNAPISAQQGGSLALSGPTFNITKPLNIAGVGVNGALKSVSGATTATFAGTINVIGNASIGADAGTLTVTNPISL